MGPLLAMQKRARGFGAEPHRRDLEEEWMKKRKERTVDLKKITKKYLPARLLIIFVFVFLLSLLPLRNRPRSSHGSYLPPWRRHGGERG